jgi:hypothetical protein
MMNTLQFNTTEVKVAVTLEETAEIAQRMMQA